MAENITGEKTEQPTSRRLSKAREEGMLPSSTEMLSAVTIITLVGVTYFAGPNVLEWAANDLREALSCDHSHIANSKVFLRFATGKMFGAAVVMSPFFLALMISGIGTNVAISGFNFSTKALKLKFNMFNPSNVTKEMFSLSSLVKLMMSVIKLIFIGTIVYFYLRDRIETLVTFQWVWSMQIMTVICKLILGVLIRLCIGLLIIGLTDLAYQKWQYIDKLKMSRQDVKEERRNTEGPPEVQRRIRQKQFEMAMRRMLQDVPKADVVLVNPTHVAVAIRYDPNQMDAPIVVAKGGDHICEKIKEVARAYGVPIIRRPAIARSLFAQVDLGKAIPEALFAAVAEVMAMIHRLRHNR